MRKFNRQDAKDAKTNFRILKTNPWRLGTLMVFQFSRFEFHAQTPLMIACLRF